jgi:hypothetical protein
MATNSRFKIIAAQTPTVERELEHLFLSRNDKTGWSVNTAIAETCEPTKACQVYCYGLNGRIALPGALARQAENAAFFSVAEGEWGSIADEAIDITHVVSRQQDFLRMFGVGDLQPGSVYFINQMAMYAAGTKPDFRIWVSTRKFQLAAKLVDSPNLHVMLSFDHATPPKKLALGLQLLEQRSPQFFAAWVRLSESEVVPPWVSVVFEEHRIGRGRAKRQPEARACPATIHEDFGGVSHDGACEKCEFCFSQERRLTGQPLVKLRRRR